MTEPVLNIPDEDFWAPPFEAASRVHERVAGREGLGLAAPAVVDLGTRSSLPVFAFDVGSSDLRGFHEHAVIHAIDVTTGDARAARLFSGHTLAGAQPPGTKVTRVDLRNLLAPERRPADLLLTLVVRGRASNRVRVRVTVSPVSDQAEVQRFIAAERARVGPPRPNVRGERAAAGESALALAVDPVSQGARWSARGSFRLPLFPGQMVPMIRPAQPNDPMPAWQRDHAAVVPIDLLLVGKVTVEPMRVPLRVAIPDRGATAAGSFALDLHELAPEEARRTAQPLHVYAFSGEHMAGPVPTTRLPDDVVSSPLA
jgi:hypothetical protein